MKTHPGLHQLVRQLSANRGDRCALAAATVSLLRQRRRSLGITAPILRLAPHQAHPKLLLWRTLALASSRHSGVVPSPPAVLAALRATQAWHNAQQQQCTRLSSPFARGLNYPDVLATWRRNRPERLLIFHHHDHRGWMPRSWLQALSAIQRAGWTVVVSTSGLQPQQRRALEADRICVADRINVGLCLGAYKDLALLLHSDPQLLAGVGSLVLCNDSTLPVGSEQQLIQQLEAWHQTGLATAQPLLAGLTDSVERGTYHLQSYLLHANRALLQSLPWLRFWLRFQPNASKDALIDTGELGLSQAVVQAGGQLQPAYGLIQGLLERPSMAHELSRQGITDLQQVNQTLFAWQSLLERGCPLVKKQVLFDLPQQPGLPLAIHALGHGLAPERHSLLAADLQALAISRFSAEASHPQ